MPSISFGIRKASPRSGPHVSSPATVGERLYKQPKSLEQLLPPCAWKEKKTGEDQIKLNKCGLLVTVFRRVAGAELALGSGGKLDNSVRLKSLTTRAETSPHALRDS